MSRLSAELVQVMLGIPVRRSELAISNAELLSRYLETQDEVAFEGLLRRHATMVWSVCNRMLHCSHDAADAFQATFMVLARRAASIQPREQVTCWLYGVARQTALRLRCSLNKRLAREHPMHPVPDRNDDRSGYQTEIPQLDRVLSSLPVIYRLPILLCDLEQKSHREAASQLGWPIGTVAGRLVRARRLLARRLLRLGVTLPSLGLSALELQSRPMPAGLISETAQVASRFATIHSTGLASISLPAGLAQGVINAMVFSKCQWAAGALLALAFSVVVLGNAGGASPGLTLRSGSQAGPSQNHAHQAAVSDDKLNHDERLLKLKQEKVKVLTTAMHEVHKQREKGNASYMDAALSHHLVCKAEYDLAANDEDRLKALTKQVKWAKQIEENATRLHKEGKFPVLDLYKINTDRIDAEIALEKLKVSMQGNKK